MPWERRRAALTTVCLVVISLGGCANGSESENESPLASYLEHDERIDEVAIRDCMAASGFEYEIGELGGNDADNPSSRADMTREWVSENGYGLYTTWISNFQPDSNAGVLRDLPPDPNANLLNELSGDEALAWLAAQSACVDQELAATNQQSLFNDATLRDLYRQMHEAVQADPRVVELYQGWSVCMADQGYEYATSHDASGEISDALTQWFMQAVEDLSQGDVESIPLDNELEELRTKELAVALADFDCTESFADELDAITLEYEQNFYRTHESELRQLDEAP